jgi:hypothetical protein
MKPCCRSSAACKLQYVAFDWAIESRTPYRHALLLQGQQSRACSCFSTRVPAKVRPDSDTATEQAFGAMVSLLKNDSKTRMVNDFKTPA